MKSLLGEKMIFTKHVFPQIPNMAIFKRSHLFQTEILGINLVFGGVIQIQSVFSGSGKCKG